MGDNKDWQRELLGAAVMTAARTAVEYATNPDSRDETMKDVRSRLAGVDYSAVARALTRAIDQLADSAKVAVVDAIDSLRENADEAVEAAAVRAQEQLGYRKRGRGKLFFGLILGVALGFVMLNEERRNMVLDKLTGATGPASPTGWDDYDSRASVAPNSAHTETPPTPAPAETAEQEAAVAQEPEPARAKASRRKTASPNGETEIASMTGDNAPVETAE